MSPNDDGPDLMAETVIPDQPTPGASYGKPGASSKGNPMLRETSATVVADRRLIRRPGAIATVAGHFRGRDRVIDMAVRAADGDGVRRCQCPSCKSARAQRPLGGVE